MNIEIYYSIWRQHIHVHIPMQQSLLQATDNRMNENKEKDFIYENKYDEGIN